jgi:predicted nucleotidyltransferase
MAQTVAIPPEVLADFCRRHQVRRLALFGSALTDDFGPESDIDLLVEFQPGTRIGLFGLTAMELELSEVLGRKVDLNTPGFLDPRFRDEAVAKVKVL